MTAPPPASFDAVSAAVARARRAWPGISFDERALAERLVAIGTALGQADVAGLVLALACLAREEEALRLLEQMVIAEVPIALRRLGATSQEVDEVAQRLLIGLVMPKEDGRPKLDYYSGRGSLRGWLRAVAGQEYAGLKRRQDEVSPVDALADFLTAGASAPDVHWARVECRQAFRVALEEAIGSLPERERTALKLNALDGLTIDDLGRIFRTHRSTAARWLARARALIRQGVRKSLSRQLGLPDRELDSILRSVGSEAPVTLERLLRRGP